MTSSRSWAAALAVAAALFAGCKGKPTPPPIVEAKGVVRVGGKPLNKAQVRFVPTVDYGSEYMATGVTDDAGRFTLTCKGVPGACSGENHVVVTEADIPARLQSETAQAELARYLQTLKGRPIPPQFTNLANSPLTVTVQAGQTEYNLDLQR
jgi:hypothetical protein